MKVYLFRGPLQRLKQKWRDAAVKEWDIARQIFGCCRGTPEPAAVGLARDSSYFINRSVAPCHTLGTFIDLKWEGLSRRQRYRLADNFSAFMLAIYNCGLFQTDYNLGNLLIQDETWKFFIIDMQAARIKKRGFLNTEEIAANLSFLLPVFPRIENRCKLRFFATLTRHHPELRKHLWRIQQKAFQKMRTHWLKKGVRNLKKSALQNYVDNTEGVRGYVDPSIAPGLRNHLTATPGRLFEFTEKTLKNSKRAKLAAIRFEGRRYILKRYNVKDWRHRLKRLLAPSLAWKIWKASRSMEMRAIPTSRLLAAVDVGKGFGYRCSYALYAYIDGVSEGFRDLQGAFTDDQKRPWVMRCLARLTWELHQKGVQHGDLKLSNIIWPCDGKKGPLRVIDLDAARFVRCLRDGQRISDLKNLASYFLMMDPDPAKTDLLFHAYVNLHLPWRHRRERLYRSFRRKTLRQFGHRLKREISRSPSPKQAV
ncbi:MAG: lipopolysaccharide kinase InaA family protein [Desulfobacteraceae bacterium]|nr:lipopolysaccharide kinase InaA family protein [Desulfobacteraceae bacterium]